MDVPSSRYSMRVQIFVRTLHFFPFFFSPPFFYACNIGGHRGSANANFHPFIPVTHNPLKRRERGEGGWLRVDWIETKASIIRDYPRMRKIFTKISGRNREFQLDEIPCFSRVRFNINRG